MRDTAPLPNVIRYRAPSSDEPSRSPYSVLHFAPGNVVSSLSCPLVAALGSIVSTCPSGTPTYNMSSVSNRTDAVWAGIDQSSGGGKSAVPTIEPSAVSKTSTLPVAHRRRSRSSAPSALRLASPKGAMRPGVTGSVPFVRERNGHRRGDRLARRDVVGPPRQRVGCLAPPTPRPGRRHSGEASFASSTTPSTESTGSSVCRIEPEAMSKRTRRPPSSAPSASVPSASGTTPSTAFAPSSGR